MKFCYALSEKLIIILETLFCLESTEDDENLHQVCEVFDDDGQSDISIDIYINTEYEEIVSDESD